MYRFKAFLTGLPLLLLLSCSSSLEYSLEAIEEGDYQTARKYLLEYCDKYSTEYLVYRDSGSGMSFTDVLEKLGSKEVLNEVYQRKFSRENSFFLDGGPFSWRILQLAEKWQDTELLNLLTQRIAKEYPRITPKKNRKEYHLLIRFTLLYRSMNKESITNLNSYWSKTDYSSNYSKAKEMWDEAYKKNAKSLLSVLSSSLGQTIATQQKRIVTNADKEELDVIFKIRKVAVDKIPFENLASAMSRFVGTSEKNVQLTLKSIQKLKLPLLEASTNLKRLEGQRSDLREGENYTFEERVQCKRCDGRSHLDCGECRSSGNCVHCTNGFVSCRNCRGHGRIDCYHCHGSRYYYGHERVWDSHHRCYKKIRVRHSCHHCHGHGYISCGCLHGRISCRTCNGTDRCHSCRGKGQKDCPSCRDGTILMIRKTREGVDIDRLINAAERLSSSLKNQIAEKEYRVKWERRRSRFLEPYVKAKGL